ncbi:StAR-related lipid transfer protein 7 mitochondrial [Bienertia sinuspersici]
MGLIESFWGILEKPTSIGSGLIIEIMLFITPIWTAFLLGLVIGWIWRPRWWESLDRSRFESLLSKFVEYSAPSSTSKGFPSIQSFTPFTMKFSSSKGQAAGDDIGINKDIVSLQSSFGDSSCSSSELKGEEHPGVNGSDLVHLYKLVEEKDGGPSWIQMMDKSTPTMSYRAWRRDPETGPPQYRSSTIFEDATPEMVRDFFWDDEFRPKWDTMLIHSNIIEESRATGTMTVQWVRKFPFFCSDREYIIGRRIWESGRTYYCVTKGVLNTSVPRKDKPRRVDLYYSSWCIRPAESRRGTGQMTACEVLLFHHEDMGIPWEIAKLGVRQGMWGAVKKIDPGLRAYQKARAAGGPLSPTASIAQITTKVNPNGLKSLLSGNNDQSVTEVALPEEKQHRGMNVPKLLIFGGAVAFACSLDRGLLTKTVIFGVARRLGRIGGKL